MIEYKNWCGMEQILNNMHKLDHPVFLTVSRCPFQ